MPVLSSSGILQFYISDLASEVLLRCENRTNDMARSYVWVRDALLEIASNPDYRDDFQELEEWGPIYNLTIGQQEYAESLIIPTGDTNNCFLDILVWVDYPANVNRRKLEIGHYQKTDRFQPINSLPTEWYRFGGQIGFNPIPNQPYQIQARLCKQHPINDNAIQQTVILLPRDWNEVLIWAAVQRGFMELMQYEKATAIHTMLYGDPDNKAQPGLIFHAKRKRRKESWRQESRLSYMKRPYGWGN